MVSTGKRTVMGNRCLRRFRRRRLLAFLRLDNLPATVNALKREARVFLDLRFLRRLVADGRWQEAQGYVTRFLPRREEHMGIEARTLLRFITHLNILDDLAQGNPGADDAVQDLQRQIEDDPSSMDDHHYAEVVGRAQRDSLDWQLVRLKAAEIVKGLVTQISEFSHLLRLPRCPINSCYTFPFVLGYRRRHWRNNIGRMPASLLARQFLLSQRRTSSARNQGLSSKPMAWLKAIIVETLLAGEQEVEEHSLEDSCSGGIPGVPVVSFIGKNCGISSANGATKVSSQEDCSAESVSGAKRPCGAGDFCPDAIRVNVPSSGMDPIYVRKKVEALRHISDAMITLLDICTSGPEYSLFVKKLLEHENLLHELRLGCLECTKATAEGNFSSRQQRFV
ncbi:hypothetical protein ACP70R_010305 [Stipagrostis hirtigluma subsp. patula]